MSIAAHMLGTLAHVCQLLRPRLELRLGGGLAVVCVRELAAQARHLDALERSGFSLAEISPTEYELRVDNGVK